MKRVRDERKIDRVELPGAVLLTGLLATIFGKAKSLRSATDSGVLAEGPLVKWLLKALRGRRDVVAHASTLHAFLRQVCVSHLQRLNVFICKRLKQMKALRWNGMVVAAVDASGIPAPTDVYLGKGALSQTRRKLDDEGNVLENKVCYFLLSKLYTVRNSG